MPRSDETYVVDADTRGFEAAMKAASDSTRHFGSVFTATLKSAVTSGKSLEDTVRALAMRLSTLALNSALAPIQKSISGSFDVLLQNLPAANAPGRFAKGGAFSGSGALTAFARGGVVTGPTLFPHRSGIGLMGEAGAEAVLPLSRGADGRLGVAADGAGAPVNVTFNVQARDAESFRRSESQLTAMLARTVRRGSRNL
ncbi:MAG: phage tail tape measure protein [Phyllobacteriaceae bacterium]|nr:phage tail tape measure protein [Phyllobacteriaceae bacterium]